MEFLDSLINYQLLKKALYHGLVYLIHGRWQLFLFFRMNCIFYLHFFMS